MARIHDALSCRIRPPISNALALQLLPPIPPEHDMTLQEIERSWRDNSKEEDVFFEGFSVPKPLRRSTRFPGALSDLVFGKYKTFDNKWVENDRVIWLGMITSDVQGHGSHFIDKLTIDLSKLGVSLVGEPAALKPKSWPASRPFIRNNDLIGWYLRHKFQVLQSDAGTRVVHLALSASLEVNFLIS